MRTAAVEDALDLRKLAGARRLCDWMFEQYAGLVRGRVAEVGAGIGTFSERMLSAGVESLLAVEPDATLAAELERRLGGDPRARVAVEELPGAPSLADGGFDLIVCQNVLEHIDDDAASVDAMARAIRPGGDLFLLVPAHPRLFGALDIAYDHRRRYTPERVRLLLDGSGLELTAIRRFNLLGVPGWWLKNRLGSARIGSAGLRLYDPLVAVWRPLERRIGPPAGLSLIATARRR